MKKYILLWIVLMAAFMPFWSFADAGTCEAVDVIVKGLGNFSLQLEGDQTSATISIHYPAGGPMSGGIQEDEHKVLKYAERVRLTKAKQWDKFPKKTVYKQCVVTVSCKEADLNLTYYLYPNFHQSTGLYTHESVLKSMPRWKSIYKLGPDRVYNFRFVPDMSGKNMLIYLDGSLAGQLKGVRRVKKVVGNEDKDKTGLTVLKSTVSRVSKSSMETLPSLPFRAHPFLQHGAKLSIPTGYQMIAGVPIMVWKPERSLNQGAHYQTTTVRDLVWNPIMERTPWSVGPEYMQWRVTGRSWQYAYVLCADIPEAGKEPIVGTQLQRLGRGCTSGNINFERTSLADASKNPNIRTVGVLTYYNNGKLVTTPLYLVRQPLNIAQLGSRGEHAFSLDFEFVGGGTWSGYKRSSVQIFGCSLQEAPFSFAVNNPIRGNIFEERDTKVAGVDVIGLRNNTDGYFIYEIYDPFFKILKRENVPFHVNRRGEKLHYNVDLSEFPLGWYGLDYSFYDSHDELIYKHEAAFTVLANDDREAGYESPYAAWPLLDGYHNSNPNPEEQMEVMRKAGYRKTWHPPCKDEVMGRKWKITRASVGLGHLNPGNPTKTRAEFEKRLDKTVEDYRQEFAKFPHCQVIQLLHEQGGKQICSELIGKKEPVRGAYRGWNFSNPKLSDAERGDWEVFFCTEYAKRMRKEFPDKRIMIGNGSSASEKIASLVRRGFDLSLVDQLGIESKGFSTMPEFNANQEAPGMLWALRETGRIFGYTHLTLNACNEYVFRPERTVSRDWSRRQIMQVTDYTLRDYLLSLAHGCDIISTGHLEDCNDSYYETNWGAGGQCKFYPYSYPKRMYTALAVLTRVLDKPVFQRVIPTGENSSYVLEFKRDRRIKDFAYACWTPHYGSTVAIRFPRGTSIRKYEVFGKNYPLEADASGIVIFDIDSTPCYITASRPAISAGVVRHALPSIPAGACEVGNVRASDVTFSQKPQGFFGNGWGVPEPLLGKFEVTDVMDKELGRSVLEVHLIPQGTIPDVLWEYTQLDIKKMRPFSLRGVSTIGIWVKGNGAFSQVKLQLKAQSNHVGYPWVLNLGSDRSYVTFDGWQLLTATISQDKIPKNLKNAEQVVVSGIICGSARKVLNPVEMVPVKGHVRLGPIIAVSQTGKVITNDEQKKADDTMKTVDKKDL